jgi:dTDP-4-dehydrorhamnose 3,5-epimerase
MKFIETEIKDLFIIEPKVWKDDRGYFFESYNKQSFNDAGIDVNFVQDNQSLSQKGTLRGLHAQANPYAQGKLVRVIQGRVLDIAVDIRKGSKTYGQYEAVELSGENNRMLWIPPGFLHGFVTLEDDTIFAYKVSGLYNKSSEFGVIWNDPELNIDWGIAADQIILSEKDKILPLFKNLNTTF